jgi:hypothetical protein
MKRKRTTQRCASCRAEKGRLHAPTCRRDDRTLYPDGAVYIAITDTSSSSSCDSSSFDTGSSGGGDC